MQLGRVLGTVVSTQKDEKLEGMKLLLVQATDVRGNPQGAYAVAVDSVGAGVGEIVLYASGSSARQTTLTKDKPVDTVIMAIVDTVEMNGDVTFSKDS